MEKTKLTNKMVVEMLRDFARKFGHYPSGTAWELIKDRVWEKIKSKIQP